MHTTTTALLSFAFVAALGPACASDSEHYSKRDAHGNYATTPDYNSMDRYEFKSAMQAGLRDFDRRLADLNQQAENLGPDALEELHESLDDLKEGRRLFEADLARLDATVDEDEWEDLREDIAEDYEDLRELLDDVYEEVVEEG